MIPISEAFGIIERAVAPLGVETVALGEAVGRVLAEEVRADLDLPPFDRSQMDGFAVRSADTREAPVRLKLVGESVAGRGFDGYVGAGETVRIMTGARVPVGADAVQKVEETREAHELVEILEAVKPRENIVGRAEEIAAGTVVFRPGEAIDAHKIAALASFGYARVKVYEKPSVAILATGSEIVDIDETPQKDQIRNSNSIMLAALAAKHGIAAEILPRVHDDFATLKNAIAAAAGLNDDAQSQIANRKSQILILSGGVSVGDYDFTKPALRELGAEVFFEKVSLKPGKPAVFARLGETLVFGLPGNPVSVAVTFYLFVRKALRLMQSAAETDLRSGRAVATHRIKGARERDSFLPVSLGTDAGGRLVIESLRFSGSSNFIAFARAEALVHVPQGVNYEAGDIAEILFL